VYKRVISKDIDVFLEKLNNTNKIQSEVRKRGSIISLNKALYFLSKKDIKNSKIECFNASLNQLYLQVSYDNNTIYEVPSYIKYLCLALLSDNKLLIELLHLNSTAIKTPKNNNHSLNIMILSAMNEDEIGINSAMETYSKQSLNKRWSSLHLKFFRTYLYGKVSEIKDVLIELESTKMKKQCGFYGEFVSDYLSVFTNAYLKLCWRKGWEIKINSPTVHMEMMPIKELHSYEINFPYLKGWKEHFS